MPLALLPAVSLAVVGGGCGGRCGLDCLRLSDASGQGATRKKADSFPVIHIFFRGLWFLGISITNFKAHHRNACTPQFGCIPRLSWNSKEEGLVVTGANALPLAFTLGEEQVNTCPQVPSGGWETTPQPCRTGCGWALGGQWGGWEGAGRVGVPWQTGLTWLGSSSLGETF